jgi:hypothetical protein
LVVPWALAAAIPAIRAAVATRVVMVFISCTCLAVREPCGLSRSSPGIGDMLKASRQPRSIHDRNDKRSVMASFPCHSDLIMRTSGGICFRC